MTKKKKQTEESTAKASTKQMNSTDTLTYQGTVKVSVQQNKKIISTKTYHNTGFINLFKFLSNALAGNYVENSRPCKIILFKDDNEWVSSSICAGPILTDAAPTIAEVAEVTGSKYWTTTYHFRIPFSNISGDKVYRAALVNAEPNLSYGINYEQTLYAGYKFEPALDVDNKNGNLSLIIEWTVAIQNK